MAPDGQGYAGAGPGVLPSSVGKACTARVVSNVPHGAEGVVQAPKRVNVKWSASAKAASAMTGLPSCPIDVVIGRSLLRRW